MSIMVVDDSKTVREYHKQILVADGYGVVEAENGMEAYEKSIDESIDLFLVDINMPIMDGYTFVENLRKLDGFKTTPIIMISTEAEGKDRDLAFENGANLYFVKPIKPDELKACVKILTTKGE